MFHVNSSYLKIRLYITTLSIISIVVSLAENVLRAKEIPRAGSTVLL
jgi:hypothetical protein